MEEEKNQVLSQNLLLENQLHDLQNDHGRMKKRYNEIEGELNNLRKVYDSTSKNLEQLTAFKKESENEFEIVIEEKDKEIAHAIERINLLKRQNRNLED